MSDIKYIVNSASAMIEAEEFIKGLSEQVQNEIESYDATKKTGSKTHFITYKKRKESSEVWKINVPAQPGEMFYDDEGHLILKYYGIVETEIVIPMPDFKGQSNNFKLMFIKH